MNGSPKNIANFVLAVVSIALAVGIGCSEGESENSSEPGIYLYGARQMEYLEKAAAKPGAKRTSSGLIIRELQPGSGETPTLTDKVRVHYHGTLIHGTVFASTIEADKPAVFGVQGVIPCWTEALLQMKVGQKNLLTCPPGLAYGFDGKAPMIRGGAVLNFEIELLEIVR